LLSARKTPILDWTKASLARPMAEVNTLFTFVIPQEKSGAGLALKFGKFREVLDR
jgi:aminoglycoside phosphotransferase (APT) family kinase protein